ncbi:MAG: ABC transporter permease [Actinomycetota bacterium]|nr:ABC transporter permease [Actinomycetota bacterium]
MSLDLAASTDTLTVPVPVSTVRRPAWSRLFRDRTAVAGLGVVVLLVGAALLAPWLATHDPNEADVVNKLAGPSRGHLLGTDELGRDVFSRVLHGARVSLFTTFLAAAIIGVIGLVLGTLAGYVGGFTDTVISRAVDILLAFPSLLLALAVTAILGPGMRHLLLAVVLVWWASYARVVRAAVLAEREKPYVEAAMAAGVPKWRVLGRHIVPNVIGPVVVLSTLELGHVLLALTTLSFLGLGVEPPTAEWGAMLTNARAYLGSAPSLMVAPGACIFLMVVGSNLLGDGLRDALDPRSRR